MRLRPALSSVLLVALLALPGLAKEPNSAQIMSDQTVAFVRVADTQDYVKKLDQTAIGRAANDPQMQPFVNGIWQTIKQSFAQIEGQIGISLEELLSIPQGELTLSVVAMQEGQPGVVLFCELGDDTRVAGNVIEVLETIGQNQGAEITQSKFKDTEIVFISGPNGKVAVCIHDNTLLASNRLEAIEDLIDHWDGKREDSLAADDRFRTIVASSRGTRDEPAQLVWYVNPIEVMRTLTRNQDGGAYVMAFLPVLGLDGIKAIGGSSILATEDFDTIDHFHVMLQRPRGGVIEMIAMKNASTDPEGWVPDDVTNYMTMNWDIEKSFTALEKLYDGIIGEGKLAEDIDRRINQPVGIEFQQEVIDNLDGRFTLVQWYEPPARINSQATFIAAKVKDRAAMQRTLDKVINAFPRLSELVEPRTIGEARFFQLAVQNAEIPEDVPEDRRRRMEARRSLRPQPCFGMLGDYVFFADRPGIVEHIALTQGGNLPRLADDLSFKLMINRLLEQAGERKVAMVSFSRPEEGLRMMYDLVQADSTRDFITRQAEDNPFFQNLEGNLNNNPLPDFKVISQYLAPQGSIMIDDETGLHMIQFSLKRNNN